MSTPQFTLSSTVLGSSDPRGLAGFYRDLLDWEVRVEQPEWVVLRSPQGAGLSFQLEDGHVPPTWPSGPGDQQMQVHLDIGVSDLAAGVARAQALGASLADEQPQDDVRVLVDPAGHPFCLFEPAAGE
ncbi:VOC family protein [Nocardioides caricicola]|uniref:VOC family protein n=1 Tax=Nocardioides caricicola TaxID=634770 RepID=A0ABW0MZD1_9ACTN